MYVHTRMHKNVFVFMVRTGVAVKSVSGVVSKYAAQAIRQLLQIDKMDGYHRENKID